MNFRLRIQEDGEGEFICSLCRVRVRGEVLNEQSTILYCPNCDGDCRITWNKIWRYDYKA